ncbi:hypothetical protein Pcinc_021108 [Petrolisthes cinctipes]|uniref:Uncharacterized protein n=1 Tax=Petrolisthes cinctipes TaxID=88211 RepID=A0AAE1FI30_PETCI|nr:hypothetical protein Pcinc_021108 [Petrolisthes cinctipes]
MNYRINLEFGRIGRPPKISSVRLLECSLNGDLLPSRRSPGTLQEKTEAETFKQQRTTIPKARNTIQRVRMKGKHRVYTAHGLPGTFKRKWTPRIIQEAKENHSSGQGHHPEANQEGQDERSRILPRKDPTDCDALQEDKPRQRYPVYC